MPAEDDGRIGVLLGLDLGLDLGDLLFPRGGIKVNGAGLVVGQDGAGDAPVVVVGAVLARVDRHIIVIRAVLGVIRADVVGQLEVGVLRVGHEDIGREVAVHADERGLHHLVLGAILGGDSLALGAVVDDDVRIAIFGRLGPLDEISGLGAVSARVEGAGVGAELAGIGTVLADDPMLNCRIPGMRSPVRVVCDTSLRIPLNSQLVATADTYETIVCCGIMTEEMKARKSTLEQKNVTILSLPGEDGHPDLSKLMQYLGEHEIDSAFIEGGGILHEAALRAGIVNHVYAFIAPKLLGGSMAKSPVEGLGAETPDQAAKLMNPKITAFGQDYLLEYDIKEALK